MARQGGALPSVTSVLPNDLRNFIRRVRELLDGMMAGDLRSVSVAELVAAGVISIANNGDIAGPAVDYTIPPAPAGLTATGGTTVIVLEWYDPVYPNFAYAEVWRNATDNRATAERIGVATVRRYADTVGENAGYYYWVRFFSKAGVVGGFNATSGVYGET